MNDFCCHTDHTDHTDKERCITCSDEAVVARVLGVDQQTGVAMVEVHGTIEEIDTTLIERVEPGDMLLIHGGVAIGRLDEVRDE